MAISEILEVDQPVSKDDIDELGHVNNEVYLHWFVKAASFHGTIAGWGLDRLVKEGAGWMVRSHYIEYLGQVRLDDSLRLRTWVETAEKATSERHYELLNTATGRVVCRGKTLWVWVNYKNGRPGRIPQELIDSFRSWKYTEAIAEQWKNYLVSGKVS